MQQSRVVVGSQIRDADLSVSGHCHSNSFTAESQAERQQAFGENRQSIDDAAGLGSASFVLVASGLPAGSRDFAGARRQIEDGVVELIDHAGTGGVPLALEPLHPMYAGDTSALRVLLKPSPFVRGWITEKRQLRVRRPICSVPVAPL